MNGAIPPLFYMPSWQGQAQLTLLLLPNTKLRRNSSQKFRIRNTLTNINELHEHPVAQLVEALRYESEGRGFNSR